MEESIVRKKKKKTGTAKKVRTIIGRIFAVIGTTLGMMILCIYLIMVVCTHGPSKVARDLFVLSVRESSAGGFLANMVVSKSTIRKIEEGNKVADTTDTTDTSLIVFNKKNNQNDVTDDLDKSGHTPSKSNITAFITKYPNYLRNEKKSTWFESLKPLSAPESRSISMTAVLSLALLFKSSMEINGSSRAAIRF